MRRFIEKFESVLVRLVAPDRTLPLQIDITNHCNLRCVHCYHPDHKNDGALSLHDWLAVLEQYDRLIERTHFRPHVVICGGEPMTSPHLKPILDRLKRMNRSHTVSLLTNGTMAERFDFSCFEGLSSVRFQVSLDGPDSVSHDGVRGHGSFKRSLRGISAIQSAGHKVSLLAILSKRTVTLIPSFFDLAASLGVDSLGFTRLIAKGQASNLVDSQTDRPLEPLELKQAYSDILQESGRTGIPSSTQKPLLHLIHDRLGRSGRFAEGLVVDYQGFILASSRSRLKLGHVFEEGLEKILFDDPILKAVRAGRVEGCGQCEFYRRCGGDRNAAFAHSGNYLGADPGCWLPFEKVHKVRHSIGSMK